MKYFRYLINYILSFAYDIYYFFFGDIRSRIQGWEYYKQSKLYPDYVKRGDMMTAIQSLAEKYCVGEGVDVGAGKWPFGNARPVEDNADENAYHIRASDGSLDYVFSSHALEHLDRWQDALREWYRVLKNDGVLFLYLPHAACTMWDVGVNPQHLWTPTAERVTDFLTKELQMRIEASTSEPDGFLSFHIAAKK